MLRARCGVCLLLAWPVLRIGSAPGAAGVAVVLGGSGLVALVLYVWSTLMRHVSALFVTCHSGLTGALQWALYHRQIKGQ